MNTVTVGDEHTCNLKHTVEPSLGSWKFFRDMGSSSNRGLIIAPGQEANSDNLGKFC